MKNESFTSEYYVSMWSSILSSYQWWGHDLISLMNNIKKTNPIVSEVFDKIYKKMRLLMYYRLLIKSQNSIKS